MYKLDYRLRAIVCVLLWGLSFPLCKLLILQGLAPLFIVAARFIIGAVCLSFFIKLPHKDIGKLILLSFTLHIIPVSLTSVAIEHVDSSIAALTVLLDVPFAWLLSVLVLKEKIALRQCIGLLLSSVGLFSVAWSPEISGLGGYFLLLVLASFLYGLASIQIKFIDLDAKTITVWSYIIAGPVVFLFIFLTDKESLSIPEGLEFAKFFPTLILLTLSSLVAFYIWSKLLKKYPVNEIVSYTLLIPISSLVLSYILLAETTHWQALLGGIITIAGVWFQLSHSSKKNKATGNKLK
jgi:O-acetylserine/cysteine efflux transporter